MRFLLYFILFLVPHIVLPQFKSGLEDFTIMDFRLGASIPTGSFAQTGSADFESGYATPGISASAAAYESFSDWLGLGGTLSFSVHGYDEDARRRTIIETNPLVVNANVESTLYSTLTITAGPSFFLRFSEEVGINFKTEAGLLRTVRPSQDFEIIQTNGTTNLSLDSFGGSSFSFYFSSALKYHASEIVGISFFVDYMYGKPYFEYITYQYPEWISISGKQDISYLNTGICLSYIVGY